MSSVSFLNASEKHGAVFSKAMPYINAVADSISERHRLASASELRSHCYKLEAAYWLTQERESHVISSCFRSMLGKSHQVTDIPNFIFSGSETMSPPFFGLF